MFDLIDRIATTMGRVLMRLGATAIVIMMIAIVVQVLASRMGVTVVVTMNGNGPLFGSTVTLNSLADLQWYLLALVALLPAGVIWLRDAHVRVDFLYSAFGARGRSVVNLVGHLVFALPFLIFMIPDAWELGARAFARGEGSPNGGLGARFLPRGAMAIGFALLLAAILFETWRILKHWSVRDD